jgi:hypothetical protein
MVCSLVPFHFNSKWIYLLVHQSPTVALNTWTTQHHIPTRYVLLNEQHLPPLVNRPHIIFTYRLYVGHNLYFDGHGPSHQQARVNCAYHALNFIHQNQTLNMISPSSSTEVNFIISKKNFSNTNLSCRTNRNLKFH